METAATAASAANLSSHVWMKMTINSFRGKPLTPGLHYTVTIMSDLGFGPAPAAILQVKTAIKEPHVKRVADRLMMREPGISFLPNSAVLAPVSLPCLTELANMLITNYDMHIEVQGHVNGGMNGRAAKDTSVSLARTARLRVGPERNPTPPHS